MIPLSVPVLLVAALVSSPALWAAAVTGDMPVEVALTRYLLATGLCWVLLSLGAALLRPGVEPRPVHAEEDPPDS